MMLNTMYKSNEKLNEIVPKIVPTISGPIEDCGNWDTARNAFVLTPVSPTGIASEAGFDTCSTEWISTEFFDESDENLRYVNHLEHIKEVLFQDFPNHQNLTPRLQACVTYVEKELFQLKIQKTKIMRRQSELQYMLEDVLLQEECQLLRDEAHKLISSPDEQMTPERCKREKSLQHQIVSIVVKRNAILDELHREKLRELREDEELEKEYLRHKEEWNKVPKIMNDRRLMREVINRTTPQKKISLLKNKISGILDSCTIL